MTSLSSVYPTIRCIAGLTRKTLNLSSNTVREDDGDYEHTIDEEDAQLVVDFMRQNPQVVEELKLEVNEKESRTLSTQAVEIFRAHTAETTTLSSIHVCGDLQTASTVRRLLSGIGGNASVKKLTLEKKASANDGWGEEEGEGELENTDGEIVSDVLQNMPHLKALFCERLYLLNNIRVNNGSSCGKNSQLQRLVLKNCSLDDEGLSAIVDALEENDCIELLDLSENDDLTSDGSLPHVTRFLQQHKSSIKHIDLRDDSKMFKNEENAKLFFSACTKLQLHSLNLDKCKTSGKNGFTSFCEAVTKSTTLTSLFVYDWAFDGRLRGADLDRLLEIIPKMKLLHFSIDLDFTNESVLTSFRQNSSICHLYGWQSLQYKEITYGPIMDILERNRESIRRQRKANELLEYEGRQTTETTTTTSSSSLPLGVWGWTMGRLARDDKGAAATYNILCKKLPSSWVSSPSQESTSTIAAPAAPTAAAAPPSVADDVAIVGGPTTAGSAAATDSATAAATATKTEKEWQEEIASLQKELQESKMREDKYREERDRLQQQQDIVRLDQTASLVAPRPEGATANAAFVATISTSDNAGGVYNNMQEDIMATSEESTTNNASKRKRVEE